MTRLEELQAELSQIVERQREIQAEMRLIKSIQRNEFRRQIRARLNEEGFTLRDAIEGRAPISDLNEATWYTRALTPLGEGALMIFSRNLEVRTTSLQNAAKLLASRIYKMMIVYPGSDGWRDLQEEDFGKIRGLRKPGQQP